MRDFEYQMFLAKKGLLKKAFHLAHQIFPQGGTCLEFGVFRGNSYIYQALNIAEHYPNSRLVGFDSWQGLPEETTSVWKPSVHNKGEYSSTKDVVLSKLNKLGLGQDKRLSFVDGFYSDSLTPDLRQKFKDVIFINIDVDIYKSTIELLDFVKPLLRPGVIIYWDDWKDPRALNKESWGEHLAWEHWTQKNKDVKAECLDVNWINQRFMVVTEANGKKLSDMSLSLEKVKKMADGLETPYSKVKKKVVQSPPISSLIQFGFQLWGRLRPL